MATALDVEAAVVVAGAGAAVLLLSVALSGAHSAPIPFTVLLLGAMYVAPPGDRAIPAPVYASALLLTAELAYWSLDERILQRVQPGTMRPRLLAILSVATAGLAAGALVLAVAEADVERSPAMTAAGAAAIVASLALLAALARGRGRQRGDPAVRKQPARPAAQRFP